MKSSDLTREHESVWYHRTSYDGGATRLKTKDAECCVKDFIARI